MNVRKTGQEAVSHEKKNALTLPRAPQKTPRLLLPSKPKRKRSKAQKTTGRLQGTKQVKKKRQDGK